MALILEEIQVFPRTIAAHVNVVEEDNAGKILEEMKKLDKSYREEVIKLVAQKGSEGIGALFSVASSGAGALRPRSQKGCQCNCTGNHQWPV